MSSYSQFYTASDCSVYIQNPAGFNQPILLDKLAGIGYNESLSSTPYYGVGNSKFGFLSKGNLLIEGVLQLNYVHQRYLFTAIEHVLATSSNVIDPSTLTAKEMSGLTDIQIANIKKNKDNPKFSRGIHEYSSNFDLKIVLNNGFLYHTDEDKIILIKGCKIVTSDMSTSVDNSDSQIMKIYKFLAREISQ